MGSVITLAGKNNVDELLSSEGSVPEQCLLVVTIISTAQTNDILDNKPFGVLNIYWILITLRIKTPQDKLHDLFNVKMFSYASINKWMKKNDKFVRDPYICWLPIWASLCQHSGSADCKVGFICQEMLFSIRPF